MNEPRDFDESIPVLTEVMVDEAPVFDVPVLDDALPDTPVLDAPVPGEPVHAAPAEAHKPAPAVTAFDDGAWNALEERLVARVLDRLQERVDLVLEDQVRNSIAPVLDLAVERLASELRHGLRQSIEQVVARAVAQELAHLKSRTS